MSDIPSYLTDIANNAGSSAPPQQAAAQAVAPTMATPQQPSAPPSNGIPSYLSDIATDAGSPKPEAYPTPTQSPAQVNQSLMTGANQFAQGVGGGIAGIGDTVNAVANLNPLDHYVYPMMGMPYHPLRTDYQKQYESAIKPTKSLMYQAGEAAPSAIGSMFLPGKLPTQIGYAGAGAAAEELNRQIQKSGRITDPGAIAAQAGGAMAMSGAIGATMHGVGKIFNKEGKPVSLAQTAPQTPPNNPPGAPPPPPQVQQPQVAQTVTGQVLPQSTPNPPKPTPSPVANLAGNVSKVEQNANGVYRHRRTLLGYDRYQNAMPLEQALQQIPESDRGPFKYYFDQISKLATTRKEAEATATAAQELAHKIAKSDQIRHGGVIFTRNQAAKTMLKGKKRLKDIMFLIKAALLRKEGKTPKLTNDLHVSTLGNAKPKPDLRRFQMKPGTPHTDENLIKALLDGHISATRDARAIAQIEHDLKEEAKPFFERVLKEHQQRTQDPYARLHVGNDGQSVELRFNSMFERLSKKSQQIYDAIELAIVNKMPQQMTNEYKALGIRIGSGTVNSMRNRLQQGGVLALGSYGVDIAAQAADRADRGDMEDIKHRAWLQWGALGLAGIALLTAANHGKVSKGMNRMFGVIVHDMEDHMYRAQNLLGIGVHDAFSNGLQRMSEAYREAGHPTEIMQRAFDSLIRESGHPVQKIDAVLNEYRYANSLIANPATKEQGEKMLQGLVTRYGFDNLSPSLNYPTAVSKVINGTATKEERSIVALRKMLESRQLLKKRIDDSIEALNNAMQRYRHNPSKNRISKGLERTLTSLKFGKAVLEGRLNEFINDFDKVAQAYMSKFMTAFFKMNPTFANIINRSDVFVTGAPYIGAANVYRAGAIAEKAPFKGLILNLTRPLRANHLYVTGGIKADAQIAAHPAIGGHSGDVTKAGLNLGQRVEKAFASDIDNAAVSYIGGIIKFYEENATWMRQLGFDNYEQLVKEMLAPKTIPADLQLRIGSEALAIAARTTGGNSFHLAGGLLARSMLGRGGNFFKQPERTVHAMVHAVLKHSPAAFFAMILVQQQLGGSAVLPPTLMQAWGKFDPEVLAYTIAMLNKMSSFRELGGGDLSDKLRTPDPLALYGNVSSTLGMMQQSVEEFETASGRLYDILNASTHDSTEASQLMNPSDKKTAALLNELRRLANVVTHTMKSSIAGVPIGKTGDTLIGIAHATQNEVEMNYPELTGKGKPAKKSEFVNADQFGGMQNVFDWPLRRMTGAPRPAVMANIANEEGLKKLTQSGRLKRGQAPKPKYTHIYDEQRQKEIQAQRHGLFPDWDDKAENPYLFFTDVP